MQSLIFDLDGTILNTYERHKQLYLYCKSRFSNLNKLKFETVWAEKCSGKTWKGILQPFIGEIETEEFLSEYISNIENVDYLNLDRPYQGIQNLLAESCNQGNLNILFTRRKSSFNLTKQLEHLKLNIYFKKIFPTLGEGKETYIDKINLNEWGNLNTYIGDTEEDQVTADKLKVRFVAVTYGIRSELFWKANQIKNPVNSVAELRSRLFKK